MLIYTIRQSHAIVIERFGKFARVQTEGLAMRIPFMEQIRRVDEWNGVASKEGYLLELTEQQTDTSSRQCHTKDNVAVLANTCVYWRITDPARALYEVDILPTAIQDTALNALRSNLGTMTLDEVLRSRTRLSEHIAAQLSATMQKWGVQLTRVEIQELTTSDDTAKAMQQQMEAERKSLAIRAEAKGQAEAEVTLAEAGRQAMITRADGQAQALEKIAKAEAEYLRRLGEQVDPSMAGNILIAQKYIDGMNVISRNPGDKVFLPNSFQGLFSVDTHKANEGTEKGT